jgi:hypothetical protein
MRDGKRQYSAMNVLALVLSAVVPVPFPDVRDHSDRLDTFISACFCSSSLFATQQHLDSRTPPAL